MRKIDQLIPSSGAAVWTTGDQSPDAPFVEANQIAPRSAPDKRPRSLLLRCTFDESRCCNIRGRVVGLSSFSTSLLFSSLSYILRMPRGRVRACSGCASISLPAPADFGGQPALARNPASRACHVARGAGDLVEIAVAPPPNPPTSPPPHLAAAGPSSSPPGTSLASAGWRTAWPALHTL